MIETKYAEKNESVFWVKFESITDAMEVLSDIVSTKLDDRDLDVCFSDNQY